MGGSFMDKMMRLAAEWRRIEKPDTGFPLF